MQILLQNYLRDAGIGSRRFTFNLIKNGQIKVNGIVALLGQRVDPNTDIVEYNNERILKSPKNKLKYIVLYKPRGYTSTHSDFFAEKTVFDLVPKKYSNFFIVGRLDKDSEGLMILTNDGNFVQRITHPKFKVYKKYRVVLNRKLESLDQKVIELGGIALEEFKTQPIRVAFPFKENRRIIELTLSEGKKREIRRLLYKLGYSVKRLIRTEIAHFKLSELGLKSGEWRVING